MLWVIGGLDPTGGAGVLRDFVTAGSVAADLEVRVAVTAWTRQGHGHPAEATAVPWDLVEAQLDAFDPPVAVKLGLVPDALAEPLAKRLGSLSAPVVVDPVMRATDGGDLGASLSGWSTLIGHATVLTPNRAEAVALAGNEATDEVLVAALAERWAGVSILLKGGHGSDSDRVVDRLWHDGRVFAFDRPRAPGPDPRGTGCALATAIACGLGRGQPVEAAVRDAITWLDTVRGRAVVRRGIAYLPVG